MKESLTIIFAALLLLGQTAQAATTRAQQADSLISTNGNSTWTFPTAGPLGGGRFSQEAPTGSCPTTSLTIAHTPNAGLDVLLFDNGLALRQGGGLDYTISGTSITLGSTCSVGEKFWVKYSY